MTHEVSVLTEVLTIGCLNHASRDFLINCAQKIKILLFPILTLRKSKLEVNKRGRHKFLIFNASTS